LSDKKRRKLSKAGEGREIDAAYAGARTLSQGDG